MFPLQFTVVAGFFCLCQSGQICFHLFSSLFTYAFTSFTMVVYRRLCSFIISFLFVTSQQTPGRSSTDCSAFMNQKLRDEHRTQTFQDRRGGRVFRFQSQLSAQADDEESHSIL